MKGTVFTTFENFIVENHGEDTWDEIIDECTLKTADPFVETGSYPDEDLLEIVGKAIGKLNIPLDIALKTFGQYLFKVLDGKFPMFRQQAPDLRAFLLSIHDVIHVEVKKLFPEAYTPHLSYGKQDAKNLTVHYTSRRKLCKLFEGLVLGAAETYGQNITISETRCCLKDGGETCDFNISFN